MQPKRIDPDKPGTFEVIVFDDIGRVLHREKIENLLLEQANRKGSTIMLKHQGESYVLTPL